MTAIRIYEPALCCDTGVCGVDVDQNLVEVTATVRSLQDLGADIQRHNLATDPLAFTTDETVKAFMHVVGSTGLPLTVVDGVTVATGSYLTRQQLLGFAGLAAASVTDAGTEAAARPSLGLIDLGLTASAAGVSCGPDGCC
jgi:arsenite-transporting ATPase